MPFEIVVPLTGESELCIADAAMTIEPSAKIGCRKTCYLLAWNVQSVPHARLKPTLSCIFATELATIRAQVALCVGAVEPA